jgi:hypothetical protein
MDSMTDYMRTERFMCQDCGHDTRLMGEMYMVDHDTWKDALDRGGPAHMLCVGCLEARLGYILVQYDFPEWIPLNFYPQQYQSLRLRQRLQPSRLEQYT